MSQLPAASSWPQPPSQPRLQPLPMPMPMPLVLPLPVPVLLEPELVQVADAFDRLPPHVTEAVLQEYSASDSIPEMPAARFGSRDLFTAASSTKGRGLVCRLLWAMPWPYAAVPADVEASRAIGGIFDQAPRVSHTVGVDSVALAGRLRRLLRAGDNDQEYARQKRVTRSQAQVPSLQSMQHAPWIHQGRSGSEWESSRTFCQVLQSFTGSFQQVLQPFSALISS